MFVCWLTEMQAKRIDTEVEIITDMCPLMMERDNPADHADDPNADDDKHDTKKGNNSYLIAQISRNAQYRPTYPTVCKP